MVYAYEETFLHSSKKIRENNTLPSKKGEKLKNFEADKKPDFNNFKSSKNFKAQYTTSPSAFKSDAEIIASIIKEQTEVIEPCEVKKIEITESMHIPEMTKAQKAILLARKYKKHHYIMNKFSRKFHKYITDAQINLIFEIARQCKQAAE